MLEVVCYLDLPLTTTVTVTFTYEDIEYPRHVYCPASCSCTRRKRSVLEFKAITLGKGSLFAPTLLHKT